MAQLIEGEGVLNMSGDLRYRTRLLLVENSLHMTGAFKSAMATAAVLRADFDVEFVLPANSALQAQVEAQGIRCHLLPMSELGRSWSRLLRYVPLLLLNTVRLRKLLSRRKIQILIVNDYYNLLGATVKATGWPGQMLTFVRLLPWNQQRLLNRLWTALAIRCSGSVVAVSRAVASQFPASQKVRVIYNPHQLRERHSETLTRKNDNTVLCLYLANYIHGKGHADALQAFARAYAQNTRLRLRFIGGDMGLQKNRDLKRSLELNATQMGLDQVVTFDGYCDDVELAIKQSDIVLNFSHSESFSLTCLEGSAYGRPVIATRCGGPEEIVEPGVTGLLVGVGEIAEMTQAILTLAGDPDARARMGQQGRSLVRQRFSPEQFLLQFRHAINYPGSSC
ncbi:MAG: glycosyltransferase family 4 protein [Pseudomonadota bacterium]